MLAPRALISALAAVTMVAVPATAQELSGNGFLFGAPTGNVALRVGYAIPNAGSDIFSFEIGRAHV